MKVRSLTLLIGLLAFWSCKPGPGSSCDPREMRCLDAKRAIVCDDGKFVEISAEEFVVDTKTAFLELAESAFRSVLPDIEPDRFSCGLAEPELKMRAYSDGRPS